MPKARLLATVQKQSGAWLSTLPVSLFGTLLDSESFRVAIALRVGADVCIPHSCRWGGRMDSRGLHGLSCRYSAGRFPRHSAMNDVIKRALQKTGLPSVLEPPGLDRGDGSRPDGITVFPFSGVRSLVWDYTCVDTFAGVHQCHCSHIQVYPSKSINTRVIPNQTPNPTKREDCYTIRA